MGMNQINVCGDQGDVRLFLVSELPEGLERKQAQRCIVAHSETGHHHVVESPGAELFVDPGDPFTCYLRLAEDVVLTHLRPWDTHAPVVIPAGVWGVRRQREYVPGGFRRVED